MDQRNIAKLLEDWKAGRDAPPAVRTSVAVSLSALVWPGLGQVYNRDFKKGLVFMGVAATSALVFFVGAGARLLGALPSDITSLLDPDSAMVIADQVLNQGGGRLGVAALVMMVTWLLGIVDAYLGARRRRPVSPPPNRQSLIR